MEVRSSERLRPPWKYVAQGGWFLVAGLSILVVIIGLPPRAAELSGIAVAAEPVLSQFGLPVKSYAPLQLTLEVINVFGFFLVGFLIFWRKAGSWMAIFTSLFLITLGAAGGIFGSITETLLSSNPFYFLPVAFIRFWGWTSFLVFFFVFPTGKWVPRGVWVALLLVIWTILNVPWNFFLDWPLSPPNWPAPVLGIYVVICWTAGSYAQVHRYRNISGPVEKQQTKWLVFGFGAFVAIFLPILMVIFSTSNQSSQQVGAEILALAFVQVLFLFIPTPIAFAILRYKLWEIDIIIRRTLSYAILTGILVGLYFSGVVLMQSLFTVLSGRPDSPLITVISTLAIAALFNPLRLRIQDFIDQRFYRAKYDAQQMLSRFAETTRSEVDLNRLADALIGLVEEAVQPEVATLWMVSKRFE